MKTRRQRLIAQLVVFSAIAWMLALFGWSFSGPMREQRERALEQQALLAAQQAALARKQAEFRAKLNAKRRKDPIYQMLLRHRKSFASAPMNAASRREYLAQFDKWLREWDALFKRQIEFDQKHQPKRKPETQLL